MLAGSVQAARRRAKTPIGPVATAIGEAITRTSHNFDIAGANPRGQFPRRRRASGSTMPTSSAPNGATARISGGTGVTYYWPSRRCARIDGTIDTAGGGLPQGKVALSQPRPGAPMSGVATFAPYTAGGSRLTLAPIRFAGGPDGSTRVSTLAQLDGPFPDGRVRALRLPIEGRVGPRRQLRLRHRPARW